MGVQEREYLNERPLEQVKPPPTDYMTAASEAVKVRELQNENEKLASKLKDADAMVANLKSKIERMHRAALTRPEVAEMVLAIERSLVALCEVQTDGERSRQVLCGVQRLLQTARVEQGAAGELPAARIGWEAALAAYYEDCSPQELKVVERFDSAT